MSRGTAAGTGRTRWRRGAALGALGRRLTLVILVVATPLVLSLGVVIARDMGRLAAAGNRLPDEGDSWALLDVLHNARTLVGNWLLSVPLALMTSPQDPGFHSELPVYELFVRESELDKLEADLPHSGRQYVRAFLKHGRQVERVKLRYRGLLGYHWGGPKRSMRVRLRRGRFLHGDRYLNFVNPEGPSQTHNLLADRLAEELGLISPEAELVHLRVNNRFHGVMYRHAQLNEYFLRKKGLPPGDLFAGEGYREESERWGRMRSVWRDPRAWRKVASITPEAETDFRSLERLIELVRDAPDEEFRRRIWTMLDRDNFLRFVALHNLTGSVHSDNKHNWRLYLNPIDGRFRAIPWDLGHQLDVLSLDHPSSKLHERVFRLDPEFVEERNRILWRFLQSPGVSRMHELLDGEMRAAGPDLGADYQKHVWRDPGSVPLRTNLMRKALREESERIDALAVHIRSQLDDGAADVYRPPGPPGGNALVVVARGVSGLRIVGLEAGPGLSEGRLELYRDVDGDGALSAPDRPARMGEELLLPGRESFALSELTANTRTWHPTRGIGRKSWSMDPEPRAYRFVVAGGGSTLRGLALRVANSATGEERSIAAVSAPAPPGIAEGEFRPTEPPVPVERRFAGGTHRIDEDLILAEHESLVVGPGAVLLLGPGVSIVTRRPYRIEGTAAEPAVIRAGDQREPWGVLACQECGPEPSRIRHARISGGREATPGRVYYSGMLVVHRGSLLVEDAVLFDSRGEDLVNLKDGRLELRNVVLAQGAGDLVDVDYGRAAIEGSLLRESVNECIDVGASEVQVSDSVLERCGDKAVSIGPEGRVEVERSLLQRSTMGVAVKDHSTLAVDDSRIEACPTSVALYRKNLRYGGENRARLDRTAIVDSGAPRVDERGDRLELHSCWGRWQGEPAGAVRGSLLPGAPAGAGGQGPVWAALVSRAEAALR